MAYVVARPKGRFEIRESVYTPKGPRARTLANFEELTDKVLDTARLRASRPFDLDAVLASAEKASRGAAARRPGQGRLGGVATPRRQRAATVRRVLAPDGCRARVTPAADRFGSRSRRRPHRPVGPRRPGLGLPAPTPLGAASIPTAGPPASGSLSTTGPYPNLVGRIISLHEMLDSIGLPHQFGGAIALAWYRSPRATTDIDVNLTLPPEGAGPVLRALALLGVTITPEDRAAVAADGQARLDWDGSYLDVFFATLDLHFEMAERARLVRFGPVDMPILAPEDLIICKAVFDRPKDWLDIEEMLLWGTEVDAARALGWVRDILGPQSGQYARLSELLSTGAAGSPDQAR